MKFIFCSLMLLLLICNNRAYSCQYNFTQLSNQCSDWGTPFIRKDCHGVDTVGCGYFSGQNGCPTGTQDPCCEMMVRLGAESYKVCEIPPPNTPPPSITPQCQGKAQGSIISTDTQTVAEVINLTGIPFPIFYSSDKVRGRKTWYEVIIPVLNDSWTSSTSIVSATIDVLVGGQSFSVTLPASAGLKYNYTWDGKDQYGIPVSGSYKANISVTENYIPAATYPASLKSSPVLGFKYIEDTGFGGWDFGIHHQYDVARKTLYKGDGSIENSEVLDRASGEHWVVSSDRSQVFIFDSSYKHVATKNALTGFTVYTFTYNISNRLTSVEDAYGNATTVQYTSGKVSSITSPYGQVTSITTDANGYITSVTNPNSEVHAISYSSLGLLNTFETPNGVVSTMTYDSNGLLTGDSSTAGSDITISKILTGTGYVLSETSAEGRVKTHTVSVTPTSYTRSEAHPSSGTRYYSENLSSKAMTINDSLGSSVSYSSQTDTRFGGNQKMPYDEYISDGGVAKYSTYSETCTLADPTNPFSMTTLSSSWTSSGKTNSLTYNAATKTKVETSPLGRITTTILNNKNDLVSLQVDGFTPTTFTYDVNGRPIEIAQGTNRVTGYTYDIANGLVATITDPLNQLTSFTYDLAGRVLTNTLPDSRVIEFSYDQSGNLESVTPPSRPSHEMTYNGFNLLSSYVPPTILAPNNYTTTYTYNDDRDLILVTRPDSQTIQRNFNATSGNLTSEVLPTGTRTYLYSGGALYNSQSEDYVTRQISRSGSKITAETISNSSFSYTVGSTYNAALLDLTERVSVGIYDSTLNLGYNNDDLLTSIGDLLLTRISTNGFVSKASVGDIVASFSYSSDFGELDSITAKYLSSPLYSETLTRDNLGRIQSRTEKYGTGSNSVYEYVYDQTGRLTEVELNTVVISQYDYDSNSNRVSQTKSGVTTNATFDVQDRLLTFGAKSFTYNLNGELTSVTNVSSMTTFNYDVFGNLKSVVLPSKTINYKVDTENRRIAKLSGSTIDNYFVWNNKKQLIGITDSSGILTARFVYGTKANIPDYMIQGAIKYQIISNHLGSPVIVVNSSTGVIAQEIEYDEFGNITSDSSPGFTPFGFAGCLYDIETKLCRFGARDYDASIGRWLSKDPIRFKGGDTNLYGYVLQDPINAIDPSGEYPVPIIACLPYGGCPKTLSKCLVLSGWIVDPEEQTKWAAQCEEEKSKKKKTCSPLDGGLDGGSGGNMRLAL